MSINITVEVKRTTVAAITQGTDPQKTVDAVSAITKAVVGSIKAIPDSGAPTFADSETGEEYDEEDVRSTCSFTSDDEVIDFPRASEADKIASPPVQIFCKTLTGKITTFRLSLLSGTLHSLPQEQGSDRLLDMRRRSGAQRGNRGQGGHSREPSAPDFPRQVPGRRQKAAGGKEDIMPLRRLADCLSSMA